LKLCRMAGIASAVNRIVRWNESNSRISPGLVIKSLATCIICNRNLTFLIFLVIWMKPYHHI
jgi:hypothetical protein